MTVAAVFGLLIPPYAAFQEQKITDIKAMEETNEVMDQELNNLSYENERLGTESEKLEKSVENLQSLKVVFEEIREMENVSLESLEEQLKESEQILDKMEINKLDVVLSNIFDVVVASDKNADNLLQDDEIESLIKKIEGINNVEINDAVAKKLIIESGRGTDAVMELLKNLLDDDPTTGPQLSQRVFSFR